ncbi:MAG: class I SAM-dependent methyltransferase [Rubrivivax sp.]|nr:class I SAM-dependent methyltransferase [Rubrivivax sp.]
MPRLRTALLRAPLPWPLPAVLAWLLAWTLFIAARWLGAAPVVALALATLAGALVAAAVQGRWRGLLVAGGFPVSALTLAGAGSMPAWIWLLAALPLVWAYPLKAWRDAPFFPTPARALDGLADVVRLPTSARVLDAGCGAGHGLQALRGVWPDARLEGVEWSRPLRWLAAWRCPWARVRRDDMWADDWSGFDLVYVFQRPESMARAWAKAEREMSAGGWLVSLEFEVPGRTPLARLEVDPRRSVWVYRMGPAPRVAGTSDSTGPAKRR